MSPLSHQFPLNQFPSEHFSEKPLDLLKGINELEKRMPSGQKLFVSIKSAATAIYLPKDSCYLIKLFQRVFKWIKYALNLPPHIEDLAQKSQQLREAFNKIGEEAIVQSAMSYDLSEGLLETIEICEKMLESYEYIAANYTTNPQLKEIYNSNMKDPELLVRRAQMDKYYGELDEWQSVEVHGQNLQLEEDWDFINTPGKKFLELVRSQNLDTNSELVRKFDPNKPQLFEFLCYYMGMVNDGHDRLQGAALEIVAHRFEQVEELQNSNGLNDKDFISIKKFLNYDLFKLSEFSSSSVSKPFQGVHEEVFNLAWNILQHADKADRTVVIEKIQSLSFKQVITSLEVEDLLKTLKKINANYQVDQISNYKPNFMESFSCFERRTC